MIMNSDDVTDGGKPIPKLVIIIIFSAILTHHYVTGLATSSVLTGYLVVHNNAFRMLLGLPQFCSAGMFVEAYVKMALPQ